MHWRELLARWRVVGALVALVLVIAMFPRPLYAQVTSTGGLFEYGLTTVGAQGERDSVIQSLSVQGDVGGFIWKEWFAVGSLNLQMTKTDTTVNGQTLGSGQGITGKAQATFLPLSPFPLLVFSEKRNSLMDFNLYETGLELQTHGWRQTLDLGAKGVYGLNYTKYDVEDLSRRNNLLPSSSETDLWTFTGSRHIAGHDFNINANRMILSKPEQDDWIQRRERSETLRHRFGAADRINVNNLLFHMSEKWNRDGAQAFDRDRFQLNSVLTWRPAELRSLVFNGNALASRVSSGLDSSGMDSDRYSLGGGMSWRATRNFNLSGNLNVQQFSGGQQSDRLIGQRLRGTYSGDRVALPFASYSWGYGGLFNKINRTGSQSEQGSSGSSGWWTHSLGRRFEGAGPGSVSLRGAQQVAYVENSLDGNFWAFDHTANLDWAASRSTGSSMFQLALSDRRKTGPNGDTLQLMNVQFSQQWTPDRDTSLTGNVTVQWNSQGQLDEGRETDNSSVNYSLDFRFNQNRLFEINHLKFMSELRFSSVDFRSRDEFLETPEVQLMIRDQFWRNRLEYRIGKLELRLEADLSERDGDLSRHVRVNVRRYF